VYPPHQQAQNFSLHPRSTHDPASTAMKRSTDALARLALALIGSCAGLLTACAKDAPPLPPGLKALRDVDYIGQKNPRQMLDLFLPEKASASPRPLVVFIHGGGWEGGNKTDGAGVLMPLLADGHYAGASIGYRLSQEKIWPAQIYDCKAALRWLQAHAEEHGYDAKKIALFGISAGGHLVSLLGTSAGIAELEGPVAEGQKPAAPVTCVLNFCGPANFLTFPGKGSIIGEEDVKGPIAKLLGGPMSQHLPAAKAASPVTYITPDDPPFLHIHGTKDSLVPYAQVKEFDAALETAGLSSTLITGTDAGHVFFNQELIKNIRLFLDHHLLGAKETAAEGAIAVP
jgi:acetyl esterase/lipase